MNKRTRDLVTQARAVIEGHSPDETEVLAYRLADAVEEMDEALLSRSGSAEVESVIAQIEDLPRAMSEKRARDGLSVRDAEASTGVAQGTIRRVESGEAMNSETLKTLLRWVTAPVETQEKGDPNV